MKAILSIKPKYVEKIFSGEKKYEFRKTLFKNRQVKSIVVYASSPVSKIVGELHFSQILKMELGRLWEVTALESGIDKEFFDDYFSGKEIGYAIKVDHAQRFETPVDLKAYGIKWPPQSFCYIDN